MVSVQKGVPRKVPLRWAPVVLLVMIMAIAMAGCVFQAPAAVQQKTLVPESSVQKNPQESATPIPLAVIDDSTRNMEIAREIVSEYHKTHTYSLHDMYVCGDMSSDVWNMLKTRGITAKIQVGNIATPVSDIRDADHVWVLAKVSDDTWVALETTGGYLVCDNSDCCQVSNPLYYEGWSFDTPAEYKKMVDKLKHPCGEGYVVGKDELCHLTCGSGYCTGNSICINGECKGCDTGYVLGEDLKCHKACGNGKTYCTGDSVCVNGECRGCDPGYILGDDMKCHQPCGSTTTYCTGGSICINGQCRGCDPGYYLGTDLRCHRK